MRNAKKAICRGVYEIAATGSLNLAEKHVTSRDRIVVAVVAAGSFGPEQSDCRELRHFDNGFQRY